MKNVNEVLSIVREQVKTGIWESEEEGIMEYKLMRERCRR